MVLGAASGPESRGEQHLPPDALELLWEGPCPQLEFMRTASPLPWGLTRPRHGWVRAGEPGATSVSARESPSLEEAQGPGHGACSLCSRLAPGVG